MSALPAPTPEIHPDPVAVRPASGTGAQLRAERRAELALARRIRRRWAVVGLAVLVCFFALTVGVLDVLH